MKKEFKRLFSMLRERYKEEKPEIEWKEWLKKNNFFSGGDDAHNNNSH